MDEAGLMAALTPVPAAARGARGGSRFEGVVLTCADLLLGGGAERKKCTFNVVPITPLLDTRTQHHVGSARIMNPSAGHEI